MLERIDCRKYKNLTVAEARRFQSEIGKYLGANYTAMRVPSICQTGGIQIGTGYYMSSN